MRIPGLCSISYRNIPGDTRLYTRRAKFKSTNGFPLCEGDGGTVKKKKKNGFNVTRINPSYR